MRPRDSSFIMDEGESSNEFEQILRVGIDPVCVDPVGEFGGQCLELPRSTAFSDDKAGDRHEPSRELARVLERAELTIGTEERIVDNVVGMLGTGVGGDGSRQSRCAVVEEAERLDVPALRSPSQFFVARWVGHGTLRVTEVANSSKKEWRTTQAIGEVDSAARLRGHGRSLCAIIPFPTASFDIA